MPQESSLSPRWLPESQKAAEEARKDYDKNVRRIAVRLAHHAKAERVLAQHVHQAVQCLHESGLKKRPWYQRPEAEISAGFTCMGLAWGSPDVCASLFGEGNRISVGVLVAGLLIGIFLVIHGWTRGRG